MTRAVFSRPKPAVLTLLGAALLVATVAGATEVLPGDVDGGGAVTDADLRLLYEHLLEESPLTGTMLGQADVNGDGTVDLEDLAAVIALLPAPAPTPTPVPPAISLEMISVPAGTFTMGARDDEGADGDEFPRHDVTLSAYAIAKYEVTNQQYADVLNWALGKGYLEDSRGEPYGADDEGPRNRVCIDGGVLLDIGFPENAIGCRIDYSDGKFAYEHLDGLSMADHPVVMVSRRGGMAFCNWLSEMDGLPLAYDILPRALVDDDADAEVNERHEFVRYHCLKDGSLLFRETVVRLRADDGTLKEAIIYDPVGEPRQISGRTPDGFLDGETYSGPDLVPWRFGMSFENSGERPEAIHDALARWEDLDWRVEAPPKARDKKTAEAASATRIELTAIRRSEAADESIYVSFMVDGGLACLLETAWSVNTSAWTRGAVVDVQRLAGVETPRGFAAIPAEATLSIHDPSLRPSEYSLLYRLVAWTPVKAESSAIFQPDTIYMTPEAIPRSNKPWSDNDRERNYTYNVSITSVDYLALGDTRAIVGTPIDPSSSGGAFYWYIPTPSAIRLLDFGGEPVTYLNNAGANVTIVAVGYSNGGPSEVACYYAQNGYWWDGTESLTAFGVILDHNFSDFELNWNDDNANFKSDRRDSGIPDGANPTPVTPATPDPDVADRGLIVGLAPSGITTGQTHVWVEDEAASARDHPRIVVWAKSDRSSHVALGTDRVPVNGDSLIINNSNLDHTFYLEAIYPSSLDSTGNYSGNTSTIKASCTLDGSTSVAIAEFTQFFRPNITFYTTPRELEYPLTPTQHIQMTHPDTGNPYSFSVSQGFYQDTYVEGWGRLLNGVPRVPTPPNGPPTYDYLGWEGANYRLSLHPLNAEETPLSSSSTAKWCNGTSTGESALDKPSNLSLPLLQDTIGSTSMAWIASHVSESRTVDDTGPGATEASYAYKTRWIDLYVPWIEPTARPTNYQNETMVYTLECMPNLNTTLKASWVE